MEIKLRYETLPLYLDFPEKKIDVFTPCDANYVVESGGHVSYMAEWKEKSIQFSIDKDCRVVIMKTMECFDRH